MDRFCVVNLISRLDYHRKRKADHRSDEEYISITTAVRSALSIAACYTGLAALASYTPLELEAGELSVAVFDDDDMHLRHGVAATSDAALGVTVDELGLNHSSLGAKGLADHLVGGSIRLLGAQHDCQPLVASLDKGLRRVTGCHVAARDNIGCLEAFAFVISVREEP